MGCKTAKILSFKSSELLHYTNSIFLWKKVKAYAFHNMSVSPSSSYYYYCYYY